MNTIRKSYLTDLSVSVSVTLNDLNRRHIRGQNFLADLHNYARTVWPNDRNWHDKIGGVKHISRGQTCPHPKGQGPSVPKFLEPSWIGLTYRATKFGTVTRGVACFWASATPSSQKGGPSASPNY